MGQESAWQTQTGIADADETAVIVNNNIAYIVVSHQPAEEDDEEQQEHHWEVGQKTEEMAEKYCTNVNAKRNGERSGEIGSDILSDWININYHESWRGNAPEGGRGGSQIPVDFGYSTLILRPKYSRAK